MKLTECGGLIESTGERATIGTERPSDPPGPHLPLFSSSTLAGVPLSIYLHAHARAHARPFPAEGSEFAFYSQPWNRGYVRVRSQRSSARAARTFILIKLLRSVEQPISYKLSPRRSFAFARERRGINVPADPTVPLK